MEKEKMSEQKEIKHKCKLTLEGYYVEKEDRYNFTIPLKNAEGEIQLNLEG